MKYYLRRHLFTRSLSVLLLSLFLCLQTISAQELVQQLQKEYQSAMPSDPNRFQLAGKYAQALFFNSQQEKAIQLLEENIGQAVKMKETHHAAYLYTVLAINKRILDDSAGSKVALNKAQHYAGTTHSLETKGYVKYGEGWIATRNNKEAEAVRNFLEALQLYEKAPASPSLDGRKSHVYRELTAIYANWDEYESQEKYSKLLLQLALKQNDPTAIFEAYMAIGYMNEQHFGQSPSSIELRDQAEQYYLKAIDLYLRNKKSFAVSSNLSFVANNLAALYLTHFPDSHKDKVLHYSEMAKKQGLESKQYNHVAAAYGIQAEVAIKEKDYKKAKENMLSSLTEINKEAVVDQHIQLSIFDNLSNIAELEGDYKNALMYYRQYVETFQSIYDKEKLGLSKRLEAQYEKEKQKQELHNLQLVSEKKEQQIQLMQIMDMQQRKILENMRLQDENNLRRLELSRMESDQQRQALRLSKLESESRAVEATSYKKELTYKERTNQFFSVLIAVSILLLLLLFYAYKQRTKHMKQREKLHILELEKEKQRSNIATLTAMLDGQEQERGRLARDLHDGLGGLLSSTKLQLTHASDREQVSKSIQQLDIAVDELRRVAHNLMPDLLQKYGLEEALSYYAIRMASNSTEIDVQFLHYNSPMNKDQELITYRVIQELVNNAIKHANASQIIIQLVEEGDKYTVTVEDDGVGFDANSKKTNNSAGLHNIESRVRFLNGQMQIQSIVDLGTSVEFEFQKKRNND